MALLDQTLNQILGPLEIALNRTLSRSPDALVQLEGMRDAVCIQLRDVGWAFRMFPVAHGVQLLPGNEGARVTVSTSLVGMARLVAGEDPRAMGDALNMQGDAEYAQRLMDALRGARIDLQAEITSLLGPVFGSGVGAQVGQGLRGLMDFGRNSLQSLLLGERAESSPSASSDDRRQLSAEGQAADPAQTRAWMDDVDDAATALDRLEARIARLESRRAEA